jgi:hypothetical protein
MSVFCFLTDICEAARSASQTLRTGGVKRKRAGNNENQNDEKEPKKIHPIVQNGLYVAEMFAAHIARQHVISFIVNSRFMGCC